MPNTTHKSALNHERGPYELLLLACDNPGTAKEAGKTIQDFINADIESKIAQKCQSIKEQVALIDVAKTIITGPQILGQGDILLSSEVFGVVLKKGKKRKPDEKVLTKQQQDRQSRIATLCDRAIGEGRYGPEIARQLDGYIAHLKKARELGVDLEKKSAIDAYVYASWIWWKDKTPEKTKKEIRQELDPNTATVSTATPMAGIVRLARRMINAEPDKRYTTKEAWVIVIIALICECPQFDPATVDVTGVPSWDDRFDRDQTWGNRKDLIGRCFGIPGYADVHTSKELYDYRQKLWQRVDHAVLAIQAQAHSTTETEKPFDMADVRDLAGLSNNTIRKYAKDAGVGEHLPEKKGSRNHHMSFTVVVTILECIAEHGSEQRMRGKCRESLNSLTKNKSQ